MSGDEYKLKKYRFPETLTNQSRWFGLPLDELIPAAICIGWGITTSKYLFGRAVASGDTDQLQAIAPGQPFRLQQTRSAADVAIMKEIVRQTPELREAVYSLINRDVERALSGLESVKPSQVPRQEGAWAPEHSVTEFSHSQEAKLAEAQQKAMLSRMSP